MPWRDWQFYIVTIVAIIGAWSLARIFLPTRRAKKTKRANLTISAKTLPEKEAAEEHR